MAINISTLFADIIDTPEQRQQKLLQQGMAQGQLLASGLTGRARALAPLAQMAGQLGVQRNEDLRRAVQPMLGIDPRTTGEKLQEALSKVDTSTPADLSASGAEPGNTRCFEDVVAVRCLHLFFNLIDALDIASELLAWIWYPCPWHP